MQLTGRSRTHIVDLAEPRCAVHCAVVQPLLALRAAAQCAGFDLLPVSGFRDFERQLAIWNGKCRGERELLDRCGRPLTAAAMDEDAIVSAILHWSALPGASRHHWGSEIDVIDGAAWPAGRPVSLLPEHYAPGGVFAGLGAWLDRHAAEHGFYRPYATDRGGVQPEAWHLSYAPVALPAMEAMTLEVLAAALAQAPVDLAAVIGRRLPEIYGRYVRNVDAPPPELALSLRDSMLS
ncbi:MAG: M15 family metallopeptidase [Steroidobacteraceae bacterium]